MRACVEAYGCDRWCDDAVWNDSDDLDDTEENFESWIEGALLFELIIELEMDVERGFCPGSGSEDIDIVERWRC